MITHVVLFKMKQRTEESISQTKQILADLEGKIPQLLSIEVGTDVMHSSRSYDVALITRFHTLEDLAIYNAHPVHQKVSDYLKTHCEVSVSVDYEK